MTQEQEDRMNRIMLAVFTCAIVVIAVLMAVGVAIGPDRQRAQGPVSDTEAACMATDLSPTARNRLGCK